jgi:hypothetical protein
METWRIENIATLLISGSTMVGLYVVGAGIHSFWPLAFLLNINSVKGTKD